MPWHRPTYLMCVRLGHARHDAKLIIFIPCSSSLDNRGRTLVYSPMGTKYSSISNWPIHFAWLPNRSLHDDSAAYCVLRSPILHLKFKKTECMRAQRQINYNRARATPSLIHRVQDIEYTYESTLFGLLLQTREGQGITVTTVSSNKSAMGCKEVSLLNAPELS